MKKVAALGLLVLVLALVAGCAAGPNDAVNSPNAEGEVPGFWRGLWNGFITPVTFVISLFNPKVRIYEVHNNGGWYDFGFLLGAMIIFGGGGGGAGASRRRK